MEWYVIVAIIVSCLILGGIIATTDTSKDWKEFQKRSNEIKRNINKGE